MRRARSYSFFMYNFKTLCSVSVFKEERDSHNYKILCARFFFKKKHFFSTQPQRCIIFSQIDLQMLLTFFLIHIAIMLLRPILYLVYLWPCLGQGLFMSYLCDILFIFSLIFIVINYSTSFKQTYFFCPFLKIYTISLG